MKAKLAGALLCLMALSGCASTSEPEWVINPNMDTNAEYYATGQGRSLAIAKKVAMSAITERLQSKLESSSGLDDQLDKVNGKESFNSSFKSSVRVKTNSVVLTGVEFVRVEHVEGIYYVEAKISKEKIRTQALSEIELINQYVKSALQSQKDSDALVWWLKYRDVQGEVEKLSSQVSVLNAISPEEAKKVEKVSTEQLVKLINNVEQVQKSLLVKIDTSYNKDARLKQYLKQHLTKQGVNVSDKNNKNVTHRINLSTSWSESYYDEIFYSTVTINLSVNNNKTRTRAIASSEVIANGSSVSNKKMSQKGAARHFEAQISDKGIWHILGLI